MRASPRAGLNPLLRFDRPRTGAGELPVGLLALATAVKLGSQHRTFVHDEAHEGSGARDAIRAVVSVHKPDVTVCWMHPANLGDGLRAARAARQAGCEVVLASGPLASLMPWAAGHAPEIDGLLAPDAEGALLAALELVADRGDLAGLGAALASRPEHTVEALDRKLLDYARYRRLPGAGWRPPIPSVRQDKGRWAATTVLTERAGRALSPAEIAADVEQCALLGIPWVDVRGSFDAGALLDAGLPGSVRVRLQVAPAALRRLEVPRLAGQGVAALDLGPVVVGDGDAVEAAAVVARMAPGLRLGATPLLGVPGYREDEEDRGVRALQRADLDLEPRVPVRLDGSDAGWADWVDAPRSDFVPPGVDPAALERAARLHRPAESASPLGRRLRRRLRGLLG